jgi:hypothetical protein
VIDNLIEDHALIAGILRQITTGQAADWQETQH